MLWLLVALGARAQDSPTDAYPPKEIRLDPGPFGSDLNDLYFRPLEREDEDKFIAYPHLRVRGTRHYFVLGDDDIYHAQPDGLTQDDIRTAREVLKFRVLIPHHRPTSYFLQSFPVIPGAEKIAPPWNLLCLPVRARAIPRDVAVDAADRDDENIGYEPQGCSERDVTRYEKRKGAFWYRAFKGEKPHDGLVLVLQGAEDELARFPTISPPPSIVTTTLPEPSGPARWTLRVLDHARQPETCRFAEPPPGAEITANSGIYLIDLADLPQDSGCILEGGDRVEMRAGDGPVPERNAVFEIPAGLVLQVIHGGDAESIPPITPQRIADLANARDLDAALPDAVLVLNWAPPPPEPPEAAGTEPDKSETAPPLAYAVIALPHEFQPSRIDIVKPGEPDAPPLATLERSTNKKVLIERPEGGFASFSRVEIGEWLVAVPAALLGDAPSAVLSLRITPEFGRCPQLGEARFGPGDIATLARHVARDFNCAPGPVEVTIFYDGEGEPRFLTDTGQELQATTGRCAGTTPPPRPSRRSFCVHGVPRDRQLVIRIERDGFEPATERRDLETMPLGGGLQISTPVWKIVPRSFWLNVRAVKGLPSTEEKLTLTAKGRDATPAPLDDEPIPAGPAEWRIERVISYLLPPKGAAYNTDLTITAPEGYLLDRADAPGNAARTQKTSFDARDLPLAGEWAPEPLLKLVLLPEKIDLSRRAFPVRVPLGDEMGDFSYCQPGLKTEEGETVWLEMTGTSPQRFRVPADFAPAADARFTLVERPLEQSRPEQARACAEDTPLAQYALTDLAALESLTLPYARPVLVYVQRSRVSNRLYPADPRGSYLAWFRALDALRSSRVVEFRLRSGTRPFAAAPPKPSPRKPLPLTDAEALYDELTRAAAELPAAPADLTTVLRDAQARRAAYGLRDGAWPDIVVMSTLPGRPDCRDLSLTILDELDAMGVAGPDRPRIVLLYDVKNPVRSGDARYLDCRFDAERASRDDTASASHRIVATSSVAMRELGERIDLAQIWARALDDLIAPPNESLPSTDTPPPIKTESD